MRPFPLVIRKMTIVVIGSKEVVHHEKADRRKLHRRNAGGRRATRFGVHQCRFLRERPAARAALRSGSWAAAWVGVGAWLLGVARTSSCVGHRPLGARAS